MTSYTQLDFDQIWWKSISQPICIKNVWFFQYDSAKCAPQFQLNSFVTMATYWVPDLPNIKGISGHLWRSIFIFANGASYTWSNKHINKYVSMSLWPFLTFFEVKITYILKSSERRLKKRELQWEQNVL